MFTEKDYLYQVERRRDDIRYAQQQRLVQQLPTTLRVTTRLSQVVLAHVGRRLSEWGKRLKRFKHSGLTVARFCTEEHVSVESFYYWCKKLGQTASPRRSRLRPGVFQQVAVVPARTTLAPDTLPQDEASITHSAPENDQDAVAKNDRPGRCGTVLRLTGEGLSWKGWASPTSAL